MQTEKEKILEFIGQLGFKTESKRLSNDTFIPGIEIENGVIFYDDKLLQYPGDLLHEAGHLALMTTEARTKASGNLEPSDNGKMNADSLEIGVILWTWAAIKILAIDPKVVFHKEGYKGSSDWYIEQFESGNYIGLPLLIWLDLTDDLEGAIPFPKMKKWLRE